MADLKVDADAVHGMTRGVKNASLVLVSLVQVPLCDDVLVSAAWRRLTVRAGNCVAQTGRDLGVLADSATTAMTAYFDTDARLAVAASVPGTGGQGHSRPEKR